MSKKKKTVKIHPAANIFPMYTPAQLEDLADSILEHGLKDPIKTINNQVIDGRNRLKACEIAGVDPIFEEVDEDGVAYSELKNLMRRHLTESQRAMAAARIALERKKTPKEEREEPKLDMAVSRRSETHARKVINKGAKVVQKAVDEGKIPVSTAASIADLPKKEQMDLMRAPDVRAAVKEAVQKSAPKKDKDFNKEKQKIISTLGMVLRKTDELQELKGAKNNLDKRVIESIQKALTSLGQWK